MRRFNFVLLLFALIIVTLVAGGGFFIQSRAFGRILSKEIAKIVKDKVGARVEFKSVDVDFFPPGLNLEHVKFNMEVEKILVEVEAGTVGVDFDFLSLERKNISLSSIYVNEGFVKISFEKDKEEKPYKKIYPQVDKILKNLPVNINELIVERTIFKINDTSFEIEKAEIAKRPLDYTIKGTVTDLKVSANIPTIDLISIKAALDADKAAIAHLKFIDDFNYAEMRGWVNSYEDFDQLHFSAEAKYDLNLKSFAKIYNQKYITVDHGQAVGTMQVSWQNKKFSSAKTDFDIKNVDTNYFRGEEIKGEISLIDEQLTLSRLEVSNKGQYAKLLSPWSIFNFKNMKMLKAPIKVLAKDLKLNEILFFLGNAIKPIRASINGKAEIQVEGTDIHVRPEDGFTLTGLGLEIPGKGNKVTRIFNSTPLTLKNTKIDVVKGIFLLQTRVLGKNTDITVNGSVGKGRVGFGVEAESLSFDDMGDIADLKMKGLGKNTIAVSGPLNNVKIDFVGKLKGAEILGYRLGDIQQDISVELKSSMVRIKNIKAKKNGFNYSGSGVVGYDEFLLDLNVDVPEIDFTQLKDLLNPLADGLTFLPLDFQAIAQGQVDISAKKSIDNLSVSSHINASDIVAYGESFKELRFDFLFKNKLINLENIVALKNRARFESDVSYDLRGKVLNYSVLYKSLSSQEINFLRKISSTFTFNSNGNLKGTMGPGEFAKHKGYVALTNTRIRDREMDDSTLEIDSRPGEIDLKLDFLGDWLSANIRSTDMNKEKIIKSKVKANIADLPLLLSGLLGENASLTSATGELKFQSEATTRNWDWSKSDVNLTIEKLSFVNQDLSIDQEGSSPNIVIERGNVRLWNWGIDENSLKVKTTARGVLTQDFYADLQLDMPAQLLKVFNNKLLNAEGRIKTRLDFSHIKNHIDCKARSEGQDINLSIEKLPVVISKLNYDISFTNKRLSVDKFSFYSDGGKVALIGDALFENEYPEINMRYDLNTIGIPIMSKSNLNISGEGLLFGLRPPYVLSGDIAINKGSILNEFSDFTSQGTTKTAKYLPNDQKSIFAGKLNLDLNAKTISPVNVNNSMMDILVNADLHLIGDVLRPGAEGRVWIQPQNSKVFFKNNEYLITKGELQFNPRNDITKPNFDFVAATSINNYKISAKVLGNPDNFSFDLVSDPALTKNNIVSLIAFGYTEDISANLTTEQKQNLTQAGVGSFIVDQFKIADVVKKQFGLQINLGTEFIQSDYSMLQGRSQGGQNGSLANTRTATKIEVKRRLSESLNLSVSSTVGGSIGQRQNMNLTYGINKNLQLEGVYQLKTNAEGEEDIIDNSIGGDVKVRMQFK